MKNCSYSMIFLFLYSILTRVTASEITPAPTTTPTSYPGTIHRVTKQQILASIPSNTPTSTPAPFLTSPLGKYTAYLIRTPSAPAAGGFGNDFCYIQIQDTEASHSVWESECAPVSSSNACSLVFDDAGLEVFDGSVSVYNTQADGNHVNTLELLDEGDMRVVDKDGELSWKASDEPRNGQRCGLPGADGLAPESPPFADVIGGGSGTGVFGQPGQPAQTAAGGQAGFGVGGELPLVDSSQFDSGNLRGVEVSLVGAVCFAVAALVLL